MDNNEIAEVYKGIANSIIKQYDLNLISVVDEQRELFYKDKFQTREQNSRDELITKILSEYLNNLSQRREENRKDRKLIKLLSLILLSFLTAAIIAISFLGVIKFNNSWQQIASVISSLIALSSYILGLIKIIAKRAFPVDDDKYITQIVKIIQKNDLKHKKENIKAQNSPNEE